MSYTIFDIGTVMILLKDTLAAGKPGGLLGFTLPKDEKLPEDFKIGDLVEVSNHPSHPAEIAMGHITGYYEILHIKSGKTFKTWHKDDMYKVEGY